MAKVLFIQPNYDIDNLNLSPWMPIALVELATFIIKKGNKAKILDRNIYYDNNLLKKIIAEYEPDIIGMTCYTSPVIKDIMQVSKIAKETSKSAMILVGGIHATLEPKSLLDFPYIDYVVRGEGEEPLLEICDLINHKKATQKNILKIKNVNYNELRQFINLNILPAPDYDLLEVQKYPIVTFYTSRGCPGRCRFCYNQGRALRFYNTKNVIETMTKVIDKYDVKEFTIADDNFANMSKRTEDICRALSKRKAIFHCFLRADQAYDKVMENLKKAGCWAIQFGFESGSQKILDFIHKDTTIEQNINAIKQCKKYNIFVDGSFMAGLPTETEEDLKQTADFIKKHNLDAVDIKVYKPFPSTELYWYAVRKKIIIPPKCLEEWIIFSDLKDGSINLSNIPTKKLLITVKLLSKTSLLTYIKKTLLLILTGHSKYALFKLKRILNEKLFRKK